MAVRKNGNGEKVNGMTVAEMQAKLAALEAKVAEQDEERRLTFKVSDKGGVSVYGLGRFPVTLYYPQWMRLLEQSAELKQFLAANKSRMTLKPQR